MIWYKDWIFYVLTIAVIICDQLTKYVVRETIPLYETFIEVGIFSIVHGQNTGSAFGLFAGFTNFLIIASLIGLALILYFFVKQASANLFVRIAVGLIVGGAVGNLIDRVLYKEVIDFLDFFIGRYHWPAFNVADSCITIGVGMMILDSFMGEHPVGQTPPNENVSG